jgi:hypothetical protein
MEKWNELCYLLSENLPSNITEQLFELKVIQAFEKLGWSEFRNEIVVRESIQLGASNRISPDLVLKSKEGNNLFIVEVKRPSGEIENPVYKGQISSYMGIMRVDIGILIGNKIQLYIDGKYANKSGIVLIDEIEFKRDTEKGLKFVELFTKDSYNKQNIESHAREKIQQQKEIEDFKQLKNDLLSSEKYTEKVTEFLRTTLLKEYSETIVEKVFDVLKVNIEQKHRPVETEHFPKVRTRNKDYVSTNEFRTLTGTNERLPIGQYVRKTFSELVRDGKIDSNEIERLQRPDYSKSTFDIQFPFLAKENSQYYDRVRYWKNPYHINGQLYFVCSQWYEVSANNDRPYYEGWLKKMKSGS